MFRTIVLALSVASASAFVSPAPAAATTALSAKKAAAPAKAPAKAPFSLFGKKAAPAPAKKASAKTSGPGYYSSFSVFPPFYTGSEYAEDFGAPSSGIWDPLGLLYQADQARFDRLRYVEVKHGRIAMLAFLGHVVTSNGIRLPGNINYAGKAFTEVGTGLNHFWEVGAVGWFQIIAFVGFLEAAVMKDSANGAAPGEFPGDFRNGFIDFGWDTFSEEQKISKRTIELNNGRAAQMGILGLMVHEKLGSNSFFDTIGGAYIGFGFGDSGFPQIGITDF
jgi:hypothetical protein